MARQEKATAAVAAEATSTTSSWRSSRTSMTTLVEGAGQKGAKAMLEAISTRMVGREQMAKPAVAVVPTEVAKVAVQFYSRQMSPQRGERQQPPKTCHYRITVIDLSRYTKCTLIYSGLLLFLFQPTRIIFICSALASQCGQGDLAPTAERAL